MRKNKNQGKEFVLQKAKENNVRFIRLWFSDIQGFLKSFAINIDELEEALGAGNSLANVIVGNAAANVINGGSGNDTLTGGAGADDFRFSTTLSASGNVDRISDFSVVADRISLDDAIFSAAGSLGALNAAAFRSGAAAADASDRIVYNPATGQVYYDADGNGAGAAVLFATVGTGLALTAADFFIV